MKIEIGREFLKPVENQIIIALQGDSLRLAQELHAMAYEIESGLKPTQGIRLFADVTIQVITPVWNGKKY